MTIVSNGPRGDASIDVFTEYSNNTHRSLTATVKIDGQDYTASVQVRLHDVIACFIRRILL